MHRSGGGGGQEKYPVRHHLSTELWLRIFSYLERNDTDSCSAVCQSWRKTILVNQKYLPQRTIDYLILSTKRVFSITACSGSVIRIFKFDKYFDRRMAVETIRRSAATERFFEAGFVNEILYRTLENQPDQPAVDNNQAVVDAPPAEEQCTHQKSISPPVRIVDFDLPPSVKTKYKIRTPPRLFFKQLSLLMHNCASIKHFVLYRFTLTNAFVERYLLTVFPTPAIQHFRQSRVKRDEIKQAYADYLYGALLKERPRIKRRV